MSKERELLKECLSLLGSLRLEELRPHIKLLNKIEELLAQPEHFSPDWASYRQGVVDGVEYEKREPLDNVEIMTIAVVHAWDLKRFARAIEKAHGIGDRDE